MDFWEFRRTEYERRDQRLQSSNPMILEKTNKKKERLHIVYVMTWIGVCGGSKIIMEHCNKLVELNHQVTIVCHFPRPAWFPLGERVGFVHAPFGEVLGEYIPKCDVIVATYWKEIYECIEQQIAPVVYFEQGDSHLFDIGTYDPHTVNHIKRQISLAPFVYTVSGYAAEKLNEVFGVEAEVIPNAVDKTIFYPTKRGNIADEKVVITAIGSENVPFKCIFNIVTAVEIIKKMGWHVEFIWISPDAPRRLSTVPVLINPSQAEIGNCLRRSDIFVCAALYESFCLPVLEAMTCGAAVVTTDNGGIRDFVKDEENALIIEKNNISDMIEKIASLIDNPDLRNKLSKQAGKTADNYDWKFTTDKLVDYYSEIAKYKIV